ncbi:type I restriction endonuclease subunit S [Sinorhizobium meliloti]|uniref:restriction endonuclease subunit S n=1 Tax=Rhizobium meliloti TaxID=382 RepID=UPI000B49DF86|nr:restriction endonuclease subunit S [Sinorhizobium meliloti]ASQ04915.1 type I restriction endonuclease subunit S [Sinorhizobium meliloti]MDX0009019.1 type I restriction endonuclease subunit S [Sinorhizobium meliloti]MDX0064710.1 type I restriction endonuclease subunit S [Sinorhizobium meliloti]MDX0082659.1 type I restriction endonuclease subunit S [Sinorhizobium meliloti]MDX0226516.1 type I restriction endonuclease subunit S [Sinorhizobium meliloti]
MSELAKGWVETPLSDLCEFNPKHDPETDRSLEVNFVPMPAVDDETGTIFDTSNVRPLSEVWKGYTHFSDQDVIFAKITPCMENGKIAVARNLANGMACGSTEFHVLRSKGAVEPDFLWRFLRRKSYRQIAERSMTGAVGQRRVPKQFLEATVLALPPVAEQKRIVAKLDALNAKSARARTELARIETLVVRYKQAVLTKAFSGELTREWRTRVKAIEPRIGTLEELLSVPVRNGLSVKGSDTPPGFPALRLSALREREVRLDDVRYIPVDDDKARRFLLETGDILVSRGNGTRSLVGIASLVPTVVRPTIFPDTAFRIRVDGAKALPLWLTSLWNAPQVRSQIELVAKTTAGIWKISQKDLATIQLSIPSTLEEQHEIVRRIEAAFARIDRLTAEARRALELVGRLDEAILARAFRGELVPQDEGDEPAEKLLERIRAERAAAPKAKRGRGRR